MKKLEKQQLVDSLSKELQSVTSAVFVDFAKMDVKTQAGLKKELKTAKARMLVVKNTLLKRASVNAKFPSELLSDSILSGQTAVILADDDPVAPIQALGKFLKGSETPQPKAGVVEGKFQNKESIMAISKLPGKLELYGQVIGSIQSPLYGLVGTLQGNLQKLIWLLQNKATV